ncbi:DUF2326 domain-containing protein [Alloscardovia omnicolens]|uniref:DUF2326 domain-containing protein n=1 Tax=Alloscardovia omnicolens TaxID=419015 RepID=UPI003A71161E
MLLSIWSPEFKCGDQPRNPILFHPGLNTVEGGAKAENAIGKSTVLSLIDFVYGGRSFIYSDVVQHSEAIGHHTIFFSLRLHGVEYHFSRATDRRGYVDRYEDSGWKNQIETWPLDEYTNFLLQEYGLENRGGSFRELVGRYVRIGEDDLANLDKPLSADPRANDAEGAIALIKLLDFYTDLEVAIKRSIQLQTSYNLIQKTTKLGLFDALKLTKKSEYEDAKQQLISYQRESQALRSQTDLDLFEAKRLSRLQQEGARAELIPLQERATALGARLALIKATLSGEQRFASDKLEEFYRFFPHADRKKLEEIEYFHHRLSEIFEFQLQEQEHALNAQLEELNIAIQQQIMRVHELGESVALDDKVYDENAELAQKIQVLQTQIKNYELKKEREKEKKEAKSELERQLVLVQDFIVRINQGLATTKKIIYRNQKSHPRPAILSMKIKGPSIGYNLDHQGNSSIGNKSMNLLIFDYTLLQITDLPFLVHDSTLIKQVAHEPVGELIQEYVKAKELKSKAGESKQVFFAFDAAHVYGTETAQLIKETRVIGLGENTGALYGRTWGDITVAKGEDE